VVKNIFIILVFALLACSKVAYAQELTAGEKQIYYVYLEEYFGDSGMSDDPYADEEYESDDYDIYQNVAQRCGVSQEEVSRVVSKAASQPVTSQQRTIFQDMDAFMKANPQKGLSDICYEFARKYNVDIREIYDLVMRLGFLKMG